MNRPTFKAFILATLVCLPSCLLFAQSWEQTFPHDFGLGKGFDVIETSDGGYVMVGDIDYPTGAIRHYVRLIKTDEDGNEQWSHIYADGSVTNDHGRAILETSDGGLLIAGSHNNEAMLLRTAANGDSLWMTLHPLNNNSRFNAIVATDDGYIAVGSTTDFNQNVESIWAVKLDENGQSEWANEYYPEEGSYSQGMDIIAAQNGGYLIAGSNNEMSALVKIDDGGEIIWTNEFNVAAGEFGLSLAQKSDGIILMAGYNTGFSTLFPMLYTLEEDGTLISSEAPGLEMPGAATGIALTPNGGYALTGSLFSFWESAQGDTSGFVIQYDEQGTIDWQLALDQNIFAQASSIKATSDGGLILSGAYNLGMYLQKIGGGVDATKGNALPKALAEVYPNPATEKIIVELPVDLLEENISLYLFDSEGHLVLQQRVTEGIMVLETNTLPFGFYEILLKNEETLLQVSKVVVANH